jgi:mono/diheme cytochrome c family protein
VKSLIALGAAGAFALVAYAVPSHAASAKKAYYTAAQATSGAKAYGANCASCHGANLEGVKAPALSGAGMAGSQSISDIYGFMVQQMPAGAPGSLKPDTYVTIMAFLLKKNGHPAGAKPLTDVSVKKVAEKI